MLNAEQNFTYKTNNALLDPYSTNIDNNQNRKWPDRKMHGTIRNSSQSKCHKPQATVQTHRQQINDTAVSKHIWQLKDSNPVYNSKSELFKHIYALWIMTNMLLPTSKKWSPHPLTVQSISLVYHQLQQSKHDSINTNNLLEIIV